jgi:hypothetical protein
MKQFASAVRSVSKLVIRAGHSPEVPVPPDVAKLADREELDEPSALHLPKSIQELGRALFHQQLWCWGQDVVQLQPNGLIQYGFERHPPPAGSQSSSCYARTHPSGRSVALWGFGMFFGNRSRGGIGMFLRRYGFAPRVIPQSLPPTNIWDPAQMPGAWLPRTSEEAAAMKELLPEAVAWVGGYEQWIHDRFGIGYREATLERWPDPKFSADRMPEAWKELARACRSL